MFKTFLEAGIINPNGFNKINERLIKQKVLVKLPVDSAYRMNVLYLHEQS